MRTEPENIRTVPLHVYPELRKWASVWSDLLQADIALDKRREVPDMTENVFTRRALWEAAVVAYGRIEASDHQRKVDFSALLNELGSDALQIHDRAMEWRHGQVAHRSGSEFERVHVSAVFAGTPAFDTLDRVNVELSTAVGPPDDSDFVHQFAAHVKALRDRVWETRLVPGAEGFVGKMKVNFAKARLMPSEEGGLPGHEDASLDVSFTLWDRVDGTGMGSA